MLGYANPSKALADHVDDEDRNTLTIREGNRRGNPNKAVINESGLYALIFGSKLPAARAFKPSMTKRQMILFFGRYQRATLRLANYYVGP